MGSIVYYYEPKDWYVYEETLYNVYVSVGEIDDYHTEPIKVVMKKDVYEKVLSGEYTCEKHGRNLAIFNKHGGVVFCC